MAEAGGTEQQEEVHLGNAELDMLPFRCELPFCRRGDAVFDEGIGQRLAREELASVHPGAEAGGSGDVGRRRENALGEFGLAFGEIVEDLAERHLGRDFALRLEGDWQHL
ncbi:hypothetical protein D9M70_579510 [compost metagenome]